MFHSGKKQKTMQDAKVAQGLSCSPTDLTSASWGHSGTFIVVPFDHYYFSSLTELFEVMWQQFCGLP
jgi:hypothetical protein